MSRLISCCAVFCLSSGHQALLEPTLGAGSPSYIEFKILQQPRNPKQCNMLFGVSKEPYDAKSGSPPFLHDTGVLFFPRHGRVYLGGEIVQNADSQVILQQGDLFGMLMDGEHENLIFYHTCGSLGHKGFRQEVGKIDLKHLKPLVGAKWLKVGTARPSKGTLISCPQLEVALKAKSDRKFTRAELEEFSVASLREDSYIKVGSEYYVAAIGKGWDHTPWSVKRLRWAVSLGGPGQKVEARSGRLVRERALEAKRLEIQAMAQRMSEAVGDSDSVEDEGPNFEEKHEERSAASS